MSGVGPGEAGPNCVGCPPRLLRWGARSQVRPSPLSQTPPPTRVQKSWGGSQLCGQGLQGKPGGFQEAVSPPSQWLTPQMGGPWVQEDSTG